METKLIYDGRVVDGELKLPGAKMRKEIAQAFEGKYITVSVERKKKHRSSPQNRYYWGVVVEMIRAGMKDMGDIVQPDQVHEFLKHRFLKVQRIDPDTAELLYEFSESTADLTTVKFGEYVDQCCQFAAEFLGVAIPSP